MRSVKPLMRRLALFSKAGSKSTLGYFVFFSVNWLQEGSQDFDLRGFLACTYGLVNEFLGGSWGWRSVADCA